jgi:dihydropteroate synthase
MSDQSPATALFLTGAPDTELHGRFQRAGLSGEECETLLKGRGDCLVYLEHLKTDQTGYLTAECRKLDAGFACNHPGAPESVFLRLERSRLVTLAADMARNFPEAGGLSACLGRIATGCRAARWELPGLSLDLGGTPLVMGILNVTPDSFYDGSLHFEPQRALDFAESMLDAGADIIDVGGESTRPGAEPVDQQEETSRVLPVIRGILERHPRAVISIDTYKADVARRAVEAGARIINDIGAGRLDRAMLGTVAETGAAWVAMHMRGVPRTMQTETHYDDLFGELTGFFTERLAAAENAGIANDRIALDPGIGFGKSAEANYELISHLDIFHSLGCPLLAGPSRKSFLGGDTRGERLEGTLAAVTVAVLRGATVVRVHDVAETVRTVRAAARFRDVRS